MTNTSPKFRIGNGYDIHRLVIGRQLIIGGVILKHPDNLGLDGHSDADVLTHSIMDALLGALSLGDIGKYFPPSDDKWKGANSLFLLSEMGQLVQIATVLSFVTAPLYAYLNFRLILSKQMPKKYQPKRGLKTLSVISLLFLSSFTIIYLFSI